MTESRSAGAERRPRRLWIFIPVFVLLAICLLVYLFMTGERGLSGNPPAPRKLEITRLSAAETERLGWSPARLDAAFDHAAGLSSDVLMIVTEGQVVGAFGDTAKPYPVHSIRKSLLSALIGQHIGAGPKQIRLEATLAELGIDDSPQPLTPLQKRASVRDLLRNLSGINHPAAQEAGLTAEKDRRLGKGENPPGTVWAYNNWDHNVLTTIFETRTGLPVAEAFAAGIAAPLGLRDFTPDAVSYGEEPALSQHRAAAFRMSGRDLARFGKLYLDKGASEGAEILPASWIERIAAEAVPTEIEGLRSGYAYLWWLPGPESGLPTGSFWAWGLGNQGLFVVPAWRTVIVHQADTAEFRKRFFGLIERDGMAAEAALEELALSCLEPANRTSEFCVEHRFILRREFAELLSLIAQARDR